MVQESRTDLIKLLNRADLIKFYIVQNKTIINMSNDVSLIL